MPITLDDLAVRLDQTTNDILEFTTQFRAWSVGTSTGGTLADGTGVGGFYPFSDGTGTTQYLPCPAYLVAVIARGDTGTDASQDFAIDVVGTFGPNERMGGFIAPTLTNYDPAGSFAKCSVAPTATYTVTIKKEGVAWGTVVFAAGSLNGTVSIGTPSVVPSDLIEYFAPATPDATFTGFIHTLRGT